MIFVFIIIIIIGWIVCETYSVWVEKALCFRLWLQPSSEEGKLTEERLVDGGGEGRTEEEDHHS
jgi:hypothetical protein